MPYDIYGRPLSRGHCEVHPHIAHEYPCPRCALEYERRRRERAEYDRYCNEQAETYYKQMAANEEYESWGASPDDIRSEIK